eukprot:9161425-Alexandrium_andersonii.AAC.1
MLGIALGDGVQRRKRRGPPRSGLTQPEGNPDLRRRGGMHNARRPRLRPGCNRSDTRGRVQARHMMAIRGHDLNVANA